MKDISNTNGDVAKRLRPGCAKPQYDGSNPSVGSNRNKIAVIGMGYAGIPAVVLLAKMQVMSRRYLTALETVWLENRHAK